MAVVAVAVQMDCRRKLSALASCNQLSPHLGSGNQLLRLPVRRSVTRFDPVVIVSRLDSRLGVCVVQDKVVEEWVWALVLSDTAGGQLSDPIR